MSILGQMWAFGEREVLQFPLEDWAIIGTVGQIYSGSGALNNLPLHTSLVADVFDLLTGKQEFTIE